MPHVPLPALRVERRIAGQTEINDICVGPMDIDDDVCGWFWEEYPAGWDDPLTEAVLGLNIFPLPRVAKYE